MARWSTLRPFNVAVTALILNLLCGLATKAQTQEFKVGGIYFFGCDGSYVEKVKAALPVHVGDKHPGADTKSIEEQISQSVSEVISCFPTDVAVINCGNNTWNIYIGLQGRGVTYPAYNETPTKHVELPKQAIELDDEIHRVLYRLLAEKGSALEDDSKGYSLSYDRQLRAKQLQLRNWALRHVTILRDVLKSSVDANQRMIAAEALGYLNPAKMQIDALVAAAMDENAGVRNNAARALACIASSSKSMAALIPCDKFIEILNSGTWTDRNKAEFVIDRLCRQDPKLLAKVKANAVQSLAEMGCWDQPHAGSARWLLAKACHLPEDKLDKLFRANDIAGLVNACQPTSASGGGAPPAPSPVDLYMTLSQIFAADQSDSSRSKASQCYEKLSSMESKFVGTIVAPEYFGALSLEAFHMGQTEGVDKRNDSAALSYFKQSLGAAETRRKLWQDRNEKNMVESAGRWARYVKASIAYLEGDKATVAALQHSVGGNDKVVARLLGGLKKFGAPDYRRDYMGDAPVP